MPTIVIREAPELHNLAQPIIREHHKHLLYARVLYLLTNAKSSRQGRIRSGLAKRLTPEQRFLSSGLESVEEGYDFMVVITEVRWRALSETQRLALLDHELCHCGQKVTVNKRTGAETRRWVSRGHDLEEFAEIVERHGLWNLDVKRLVAAGAQLALELPKAEPQEALPPVRETTVDEQGVVLTTQMVQELGRQRLREEHPEIAQVLDKAALGEDVTAETALEAAAEIDDAGGRTGSKEDIGNDTIEAAADVAQMENGHAGDWQGTTGIGQSELEQHRAQRRRRQHQPDTQ